MHVESKRREASGEVSRRRFGIESLAFVRETLTRGNDFLFGMQLRTACGRLNAGSAAVASSYAAAGKPTGLS